MQGLRWPYALHLLEQENMIMTFTSAEISVMVKEFVVAEYCLDSEDIISMRWEVDPHSNELTWHITVSTKEGRPKTAYRG